MTDVGDRLSRGPLEPDRFSLQREFYGRLVRSMQAMLGQDPQQIKLPIPKLGERMHYEATILDASGAPFRANGKAFWIPINGAATPAVANQVQIKNYSGSKAQPNAKVVVLDSIVYAAGSALEISSIGILSADTLVGGIFDVEAPASLATAGVGSAPRPTVGGITVIAFQTALPFTTGQFIGQLPPGPGPYPLGNVIFPGEEVDFTQLTVNIAFQGMIYGRVWDFGPSLPTQY